MGKFTGAAKIFSKSNNSRTGNIESVSKIKGLRKLMDLKRDLRKTTKTKAAKAIYSTIKEDPIDTAILATGAGGDPLAIAAGANLAAQVDTKLKEALGRSTKEAEAAADYVKKNPAKTAVVAAGAGALAGATIESAENNSKHRENKKMNDGSLMSSLAVSGPKKSSASAASSIEWALFIWVILVQAFDFSQNFRRDAMLGILIACYLFSAVFAAFVFHRNGNLIGDIKQLLFFVVLSAVSIIIPVYLYIFPAGSFLGGPGLFQWASFFIKVFPIWPLYVAHKLDNEAISRWTNRYVTFWIIGIIVVFIFYFGSQINTSTLVGFGGLSQDIEAQPVMNFLWQKTIQTSKNFYSKLHLDTALYTLMNASGIYYYTGVLEGNTDQPVGLYITNVRPADRYFFENSPVIIWADVRGKSFKNEIHAYPHCYIDTVGTKKGGDGETSPSVMNILGEEHDSLQCTFSNLSKGSYTVKLDTSFNFQTWAYVTYTFTDLEFKRAIEVQGKSINSELDILAYPLALYTDGPMMLGMGSTVDQPVAINTKSNDRDAVLGVTLDDRWSEGHLDTVNNITLQIPDDFDLINCDRWYPDTKRDPIESKDGYDYYRFTREELKDPRVQFKSVTCRVHIKDAQKFLSGQQKVQRTFVAQADYIYLLEKTTSVTVKQ
jgi:hypothetical protein